MRELIAVLDTSLGGVPQNTQDSRHRTQTITSVKNLLGNFGIDGESLIRYGMSARAASAVYRAMFSPDDDDLTRIVDTTRWRQVLKVPTPTAPLGELDEAELDAMSLSLHRVPHLLDMWVANAPIADILRYAPPSDTDWSQWALLSPDANETISAYHWLLQRSITETLGRWSTESLHLEYRWQNDHQVGLFSAAALSTEGPKGTLLNAEIALRAVAPQLAEQVEQDQLFWQLQETAVDYLVKGKYLEAKTLFEFHLRRNLNDARTLNNLGFCSFPLSASKALHWLQDAAANGYVEVPINIYNQCCCLVTLNRSGDALDLAENYWQRQRRPNTMTGFLWVQSSDTWTLTGDCAAEQELVDLAIAAAREVGRGDRATRWEERKVDLASASASAARSPRAIESGAP
ncbi:hypothetical protein [Cryobacterium sp. TMT3-29-2]|uniref:hypothetical protein n=1 Tax=Cryobacterium sp. TMT3-29-2 TaxID=2555867 RepID=UPI001072F378|nr:hypothetical protein [Cryobacterium sp. TMT3-29-2]TFC93555.1 hypothetical protein E3O67_01605 [Cryobacterium sp. TMT3-29-2]